MTLSNVSGLKSPALSLPHIRDRVSELYAQTPVQLVAGALTAVLLFVVSGYSKVEALERNAALIAAAELLRLGLWAGYMRAIRKPALVPSHSTQAKWFRKWEALFLICSGLSGIALGFAASRLLVSTHELSHVLSLFLLAPSVCLSITLAPASARATVLFATTALGIPLVLNMITPTAPLSWLPALIVLLLAMILWIALRLEKQAQDLAETTRQCTQLEAHAASLTYQATRSRDVLNNVINSVNIGIAIYDKNLILIARNQSYLDLFPTETDQIHMGIDLSDVCRIFRELHSPNSPPETKSHIDVFAEESGNNDFTIEHTLMDGRRIHVQCQRMPDQGWVFTSTDMTSGRQAQTEALLHFSRHDSLTGLPNRAMIRRTLERKVALIEGSSSTLSVMVINITNFRSINESHGSDIGDEVLVHIANKLATFANKDSLVGRLGSDEFALIQIHRNGAHHPVNIAAMATELVENLQAAINTLNKRIEFEVAVGATHYPEDNSSPDKLLRHAGFALNKARASDKTCVVVFDRAMQNDLQARADLEIEIRNHLNSHQFSYHYQPQIDLQTKQLVGVEALLRWHHPTRGWISPGQFIPVAEMSRLIIPLTERMLPEVCEQILIWDARGLPKFKVAINLSPIHIQDGTFADFFARQLDAYGLSPERFEFEITESVMMSDSELAVETLRMLEEMGASLAVDDFGTGYASISYLRQFPVSKLKIDQSFVQELTEDHNARSIVAAVTRLGHSFGLRVVAEGVETEDQARDLAAIHCDMAQGFLFSQALTGEDFIAWAENRYVRNVISSWPPQPGVAAR